MSACLLQSRQKLLCCALLTTLVPACSLSLSTGVCYSIELSGEETVEEPLRLKAENLGGHCTGSADAADLVRLIGIDG